MSLSALIVDDEQLARDELAYLLKNSDDVNVVAQGKNGLEAVNLIKEHSPDLVFLDVQMPGLDGFGVIKKLLDKKIPLPKIVFCHRLRSIRREGFRSERRGLLAQTVRQETCRSGSEQGTRAAGCVRCSFGEVRDTCANARIPEATRLEDHAQSARPHVSGGPERHLLCVD